MLGDAVISDCGDYRYLLTRRGLGGERAVAIIMLNPSTATATEDDPTVRRCIGFAQGWGYRELLVGNLFALRATDPAELKRHPAPIGPDNDRWLRTIAGLADVIVCAWGSHGRLYERSDRVLGLLPTSKCWSFGFTRGGQPKHPLYLPKTAELVAC